MTNNFYYDSTKGIIEINGREIKDVTKLNIEHIGGCLPTVTLEFNANLKLKGNLINKIFGKQHKE